MDDEDQEIERILALTDEEIAAEHLALYGGDKRLADRATSMLQAEIQRTLSKYWKQ